MEWSSRFIGNSSNSATKEPLPSTTNKDNLKTGGIMSNQEMNSHQPNTPQPEQKKNGGAELVDTPRDERCPPPIDTIFCDSMSTIAEMLSFDSDDSTEGARDVVAAASNEQMTPSAVGNQYYGHRGVCLTPDANQTCQRRGRFLVWPANLSAPSLALPDTRG
ncbi:expressed unknown protein [Seminavis robusta]|uniref:Uncharacterized protein n=1 Tax=Seminavis robusta TaxID=568900 RepID=A0A9N8EVZ0_9STRA|nr:expressed unknown protein [Seminavis robusta]|eukprot:Sro1850_g301601.1  (162) ;mRNA; f:14104-14589